MLRALLCSLSLILISSLSQARIDQSLLDQAKQLRSAGEAVRLFSSYKNQFPGAYSSFVPGANGSTAKTKKAALLIHSYTMRADEMGSIARILAAQGMNVIAIELEGHGPRNRLVNLADISHKDWMADAEFGLSVAKALGDQVVVVGYSLGGLLATYLAKTHPKDVSALVAIAPALGISIEGARFSCLARDIVKSGGLSDLSDYQRQFVAGACAIRNLIDVVIPPQSEAKTAKARSDFYFHLIEIFGEMKTPALVAYTEIDEIVSYREGIGPMVNYMGRKPTVLKYTAQDSVGHMGIINNRTNFEGRNLHNEILKLISSI